MHNSTLVAFYRDKPNSLVQYIRKLQRRIGDLLPADVFIPYPEAQVHGTLTGLEGIVMDGILINKNLFENEAKRESMDLSALSEIVKKHFPMQIRFGGFRLSDTSFLSRGKQPYERSFHLDRQGNRAVLMGWPHNKGDFSISRLMQFRDEMKVRCKTAHKYSRDNDFFMVLGELERPGLESFDRKLKAIHTTIRDYLSSNPLEITVHDSDLKIVRYTDRRLPLTNETRVYTLQNFQTEEM